MCPDDFFGKSWWKTHSSTFFGIEDTLLWYMARVFQQECINCTLCPRERSDENSVFFETFVFLSFSENEWIFSDFRVIFWQGCQCCKRAVLRSNLRINFVLKKFCLSVWDVERNTIRTCWIIFCKSVKTAVYVSKGTFRGIFLREKKFSISSGVWLKFIWIFEEVFRLDKHNCPLSVSFQRNSPKKFLQFSEVWPKLFQFLSKNVHQGFRRCLFVSWRILWRELVKIMFFQFFWKFRTQFSDIWREYSKRKV